MFGKLVKYDFKAIGKWYLGLLAITAVIAAITGMSFGSFVHQINRASEVSSNFNNPFGYNIALPLLIFILFALIFAVTLACFAIVVRHFYRDIYSRRGYLTMTLPVSSHTIILSKLLVSVLLFLLTYLSLILSFVLFVLPFIPWSDLSPEVWAQFAKALSDSFGFMSQQAISSLFGIVQTVLTIYLAISLGQLFTNHRVLMGFVSYFGLLVVGWFIDLVIQAILGGHSYLTNIASYALENDGTVPIHLMIISLLVSILISVGCYFGTHYIMTNKLNLE